MGAWVHSDFKQRRLLLRRPPFLFFLLHSLFAIMGGAMAYVALTWYVLSVHNQLSSVIYMAISFWLPAAVCGPFAGVVIDRYPRQKVLLIANMLRAICFILFAVFLSDVHTAGHHLLYCYLLNFINGVLFALIGPGVMATVRELVSPHELLAANSSVDAVYEVGNIAGIALAAVFIQWVGAIHCILYVGWLIVLAVFLLSLVQVPVDLRGHQKKASHPWRDFISGFRYLARRPKLRLLYVLNALLVVQFMVTPILLAPFVKQVLHAGSAAFSGIEVALSIGILVGSLCLPTLARRFGWFLCMTIGCVLLIIAYVAFSLNHALDIAVVLYAAIGLCLPIWTLAMTRAQEGTYSRYQGRVQSTFSALSSAAILAVYLLLHFLTGTVVLVHFYWLCAAMGLLVLGVLWKLNRLAVV